MKRKDPDISALKACVIALEGISPRMQRATLEYLWDRFVMHPRQSEPVETSRARVPDEQD